MLQARIADLQCFVRLAVLAAALAAAGASQAQARCAYIDVHRRGAAWPPAPSLAPGVPQSAKDVCFNGAMRCTRPNGCFKAPLRLSREFVSRRPDRRALQAHFGFIDPDGLHWDVPPGYATDGATIPPSLQPLVGSSWDRDYIRAAVIHDFYIRNTTIDPLKVHEVFFHALLASGVRPYWASLMHRAVRRFGPTWKFERIDLVENERARLHNVALQQEFDRKFNEAYARCRDSRRKRFATPPGSRGVPCPLASGDEFIFSLTEALLQTAPSIRRQIEKDIPAGRCRLGADGIYECPGGTTDLRERRRQ
ncbi:MAG: DUF1353 domain-containing protein [Hyphomicrobiaceae bacterium]